MGASALARIGDVLVEVSVGIFCLEAVREIDLADASLVGRKLELALWLASDFGSHGKRCGGGSVCFGDVQGRLCWQLDDLVAQLCGVGWAWAEVWRIVFIVCEL